MLAGNVTATVSKGTAEIKGDNFSNAITITPGPSAFVVRVTGVNDVSGLPTSVNGTPNGVADLGGVIHGLNVNMGPGNNNVTVTNLTINGKTTIKSDGGVDRVQINASTFNSSFKAQLGKSADVLTMINSVVAGKATVKGGSGHDVVTLTNSNFGALKVSLGRGNDTLIVAGTTVITKSTINGGKGINPLIDAGSNFYGGTLLKKNVAGLR